MFEVTLVDANGNEKETISLKNFAPWDFEGITKEEYLAREMAVYCDCDEPDEYPEFVEGAYIKGVGRVNKHGYLCRKCGKFVQIG